MEETLRVKTISPSDKGRASTVFSQNGYFFLPLFCRNKLDVLQQSYSDVDWQQQRIQGTKDLRETGRQCSCIRKIQACWKQIHVIWSKCSVLQMLRLFRNVMCHPDELLILYCSSISYSWCCHFICGATCGVQINLSLLCFEVLSHFISKTTEKIFSL